MKVRELLQIEIWSKRTSRRILVGFGIAIAGFLFWCAVQQNWLTPGERSAARTALAQIDGLQNFDSISDEDFHAEAKRVDTEIRAAQQAAWTSRDKGLAASLEAYMGLTLIDQEEMRRQVLLQQDSPTLARRDQEFALEMETTGKKARLSVRLTLHGALD